MLHPPPLCCHWQVYCTYVTFLRVMGPNYIIYIILYSCFLNQLSEERRQIRIYIDFYHYLYLRSLFYYVHLSYCLGPSLQPEELSCLFFLSHSFLICKVKTINSAGKALLSGVRKPALTWRNTCIITHRNISAHQKL